jgi:hypothetical protein
MYASRWVKVAVLYFVVGVGFGLYMAAYSDVHPNPLSGLHAHINLLGWVSMALFACIYRAFPALEQSKLAAAHFWLYQTFLPIMMAGLYLILTGMPEIGGPVMGITAHFVVLSIVLMAVSVWTSVKKADAGQEVSKAS